MAKQDRKRLIFSLAFFSLLIGLLVFIYRQPLINSFYRVFNSSAPFGTTRECPGCAAYFPDVVSVMERAYRREGIEPQPTFQDLDMLHRKGVLVKITSNEYYRVISMEDARPYVLPKVKIFLDDLSLEYERRLKEKQLAYIPFVINSATRSIVSAKALAQKLKIAREDSHHLLGKTIDLSYVKFGSKRSEQICFIEALRHLRTKGRCYVKYEKTGALHTTVR